MLPTTPQHPTRETKTVQDTSGHLPSTAGTMQAHTPWIAARNTCGERSLYQPTACKMVKKKKFKVRQPQRAAKSKRPNAPSDGSKNNGIHTTKQEEYPSRHPTTDTANSSTSKQITSRRLIGVSKSNTIQSTNQAGCPVSPPHMYHPRRPAHQPRLIPKHVAI